MTAWLVRLPFSLVFERFGRYRVEPSIVVGRRFTLRDERALVVGMSLRASIAF